MGLRGLPSNHHQPVWVDRRMAILNHFPLKNYSINCLARACPVVQDVTALSNHHFGPDQSYGHCQITTLAQIKAMDIVKSPLWPRSLLWTLSNHHSGPDQSYGHCQITTLAQIKAADIVKSPLWPRSKLWALSNHLLR